MSNINIIQFQQPVIVLSITQLEINPIQQANTQQQRYSNRQNINNTSQGEPILCYVYLDDKIQDVRGICRDETKINLCENLHNNLTIKEDIINKSVLIQVKQGGSINIGFVKIPIKLLVQSSQTNHLKLWFPLFKEKQHEEITYERLQNDQYNEYNKIYVDIKLQEEFSLTRHSYSHTIQANNPFKGQQDSSKISNNQHNSSDTYQEISEHITLIQGQPFQESQKIIAQSLGQQIFKKKKKTYTQSANPQIQLIPETPVKQDLSQPQKQKPLMTPQDIEKLLIPNDLLQLLPTNIDKNIVKQDLCQTIDQNIQYIIDQSQVSFKEMTNIYQNIKLISQTDNKDLIVNDRRHGLLGQIATDTQVLINTRKDQENQVQQLQTQIKLIQIHGGHQQKREKLENLQQTIEQLKNDIKDIQNNKLIENKTNLHNDLDQHIQYNQSTEDTVILQDQISYLKQELQMLIQLTQQKINTKSVLDSVFNETDIIKDQFMRQQEDMIQQIQIFESDKNNLDKEQLALQQELLQLKRKEIESQQIIQRQQLELKFKNKQIEAEQLSIKTQNDKLQELIEKQKTVLSKKQLQHQQQEDFLNNLLEQKSQQETEVQKEKDLYEELLKLQISDGDCLLNNQEVQQNQLQLQELINELQEALNKNKSQVRGFIEVCNQFNTNISDDSLQKILRVAQDGNDNIQILHDKNEILNTKSLRCVDLQTNIDQAHDQIDYQLFKSQIYNDFQLKLNELQAQDQQVQFELQKIRKINKNLIQINQDSHEKLDIQQSDFQQFDQDLQSYTTLKHNQRQKEQQMLDRLLTIRTKQEFDNDMRNRLQQIRELENYLRGKDHELDTLEMIQQQKDEIILDLEEQAGKVREIVTQGGNNYQNQNNKKHHLVEQALKKYLQLHPSVIEIQKIGDGYFKYGTRRIYVKLNSMDQQSTLLVRIAPKEYITLNMFIIENENIELNKLAALNQQFNHRQQVL